MQLMSVESGMIDVAGVRRLKCNADIEARKCRSAGSAGRAGYK